MRLSAAGPSHVAIAWCGGIGARASMSEPLPPYTRRDASRPSWAHNYSRPNDTPPSYSDSVRWFFYNSLRPAYLALSLIGTIAAVVLCAVEWRSMAVLDGKAKTLTIASAALFTACVVLLLYAFLAGLNQHIHLLRTAVRLAPVSVGLAVAASAISLANVYANKSDVISQCIYNSAFDGVEREEDGPLTESRTDVSELCRFDWNEEAIWNIAWFILIVLYAVFYLIVAHRFLNKAENPGFSSARTRPLTADDNHDFQADFEGGDGYVMGGLSRRDSADTLAQDEAMLDAKMDPMADVYGGRRDPSEYEAFVERESMDYPPIQPSEKRTDASSSYVEPTITPVSHAAHGRAAGPGGARDTAGEAPS